MAHTRLIPTVMSLVLVVAACGGGETAETTDVTTAAPSSTGGDTSTTAASVVETTATTVAETTSTTTTTLPPPPVIGFDAAVIVEERPPLGFFGGGTGDITGMEIEASVAFGDRIVVLGSIDEAGPWVNMGGFETRSHYTDTAAWSADEGVWGSWPAPPRQGHLDEVAHAGIAFGDGLVAVGSSRESGQTFTEVDGVNIPVTDPWRATFWFSEDGRTWSFTEDADPAGYELEARDITAGGPGLVAVGSSSLYDFPMMDIDGAIWVSGEPGVWTRLADPDGIFSGPGFQDIAAVVEFGGDLYAFGQYSSSMGGLNSNDFMVWRSTDGLAWEALPASDGVAGRGRNIPEAAVATDDGIVVVGWATPIDDSEPAIWFSPDGEAWESIEGLEPGAGELTDVAAFEGGYIAVGRDWHDPYPLVMVSSDGRHWEPLFDARLTPTPEQNIDLVTATTLDGEVYVAGHIHWGDGTDLAVWRGVVGRPPVPAELQPPEEDPTVAPEDLQAMMEDLAELEFEVAAAVDEMYEFCPEALEMLESGENIDDLVIQRCMDAFGRGMMAVEQAEILADAMEEMAPGSAEAAEAREVATALRAMFTDAEQSFVPPEP